MALGSVADPNLLNLDLDPDPVFCPNLDTDLDHDPHPDDLKTQYTM